MDIAGASGSPANAIRVVREVKRCFVPAHIPLLFGDCGSASAPGVAL